MAALLWWRCRLTAASAPVVEQLRDVLRTHPGVTEVHLRLCGRQRTTVVRLDHKLRVSPSPALLGDLKQLLGSRLRGIEQPEGVRQPVVQGRSLSGLRTAQMCLIRSPATSNANTVTVTPSCWATRPGWPLTVRSRIVMLPGARLAISAQAARDLLGAFDGAQEGDGEAAAVGDRRGVGVEQADEGVDVLGFPGLLEVPDDVGLPGGRGRGSLRGADAAAGGGGQLAAGRRGAADDLGHLGEGVAEDVVQDERDALGRGHRVEHDEEGHADRLVQGDPVGRVGGGAAGRPLIHSVGSGSGSGIHSPT